MFQPVRMDVFRISGIYMYMGCFLKWWENSPQIIPWINRVFHDFHHPFWGTTIFGNTHIFSLKTNKHRIFMDVLFLRVPEDMILLPQNKNPMVTLKLILMFFFGSRVSQSSKGNFLSISWVKNMKAEAP